MASTIAFVLFDLLGMVFLLWCLAHFYRESRRYRGADVEVLRFDPLPGSRTASVVTMHARVRNDPRDRVVTPRHAIANGRVRRG